jgi:hypothetical protein
MYQASIGGTNFHPISCSKKPFSAVSQDQQGTPLQRDGQHWEVAFCSELGCGLLLARKQVKRWMERIRLYCG